MRATTLLATPQTALADPDQETVWAVRRDWPDSGGHEFIQPRGTEAAVVRAARADRRFWLPGPIRPAVSVVQITVRQYHLHSRANVPCRETSCPAAVPAEQ